MNEHLNCSGGMANRRFSVPCDSRTAGRLVFTSGVIDIYLYGAALMPDFYQAHFEKYVPKILVNDDTITVHFRQLPPLRPVAIGREADGKIALNGTLSWGIEARGGVSNVTADLSQLQLHALDLASVSQTVIMLPEPSGTAYIYISGSASDVTIWRPQGTAGRVQIGHNSSHLRFDEQYFGAISDAVQWQTPHFRSAVHRYDITIAGSASNLTVEEQCRSS